MDNPGVGEATNPNRHDWSELVQSWAEGDLNQSEFCRQHGVSLHRFNYWKRKLLPDSEPKERTQRFVPVSIAADVDDQGDPREVTTVQASPAFSLQLPNGLALSFPSADHPEKIAALASALVSVSC